MNRHFAPAFLLLLLIGNVATSQVEVIVATTGDKADIGMTNDSIGFMYSFSVSPNGLWWAGEFELDNALDSLHLRGRGLSASDTIWVEGEQAPGGLAGTIRSVSTIRQTNINNTGQVVGLARNIDQGVTIGELVYRYDGNNFDVAAATDLTIPALAGTQYGPAFFSPNSNINGEASFVADNITGSGITSANDAVSLYGNGTVLGQQKGVNAYAGELLQRFDEDRFLTNQSGSRFIFSGDTVGSTDSDDLVIVGDVGTAGSIVLQENVTQVVTSQGMEIFDTASQVLFGGDDEWYVAGDTVGGTGVVIRDGEVLASEGDLAPDGFDYIGDPFALAADPFGNYAWAWETSNPDLEQNMLLVYNGTSIVLQEGNTFFYDTDGDGDEEEVRMDRLFQDFVDLSLADNYIYLMTEIDDPDTTTFQGYAFVRVGVNSVPEPSTFAAIAVLFCLALQRRNRISR